MLIVEGPDGSGKTTLCRTLSAELNLELAPTFVSARRRMPEQGVRQRTWNGLSAMLRGQSFIHDRLYFSELVYGSVLRRSVQFEFREQMWIESALEHFSVPVIVCLPSLEVVRENAAQEQQIPGVIERLAEIYHSYYRLVNRVGHYRPYDYTSEHDTIPDLLDWVNPKLDQQRRTFGVDDAGRAAGTGVGAEWGVRTEDSP